MELQVQLEGTENRVATARQDYNDAVRTYNGFIRRFPQALTAKATGAEAREYFEITSEEVRDVPTVIFD
jgi:LemA protein